MTARALTGRGLPEPGGERAIAWVERYLKVPKGHGAGKPVRLRPWQQDIVSGLFSPPRPRQALVSLPRGNGKTALAAMLALREIFDGPESAEALVVASDQRQAEITLRMARRMVELDYRLSSRCQVYRDRLYVPHRDSTLLALPAEPAALQGWDPSLLLVDELHVVTHEVWEAATTASGKRPESLTLAISTPATNRDGAMWALVEHGRAAEDPSFRFWEWSAPPGCAIDDEEAWAIANPALGDFLAVDAMRALLGTTRASTFRQLRLGQWVEGEAAWITHEAWAACDDADRLVDSAEPVVLAFDGSASGDSTALIGCTVRAPHHLFTVATWNNPGDPRWRVPRGEVDRTVDEAFADYNVVELAADPWGWRSEIEAWAKRFGSNRVLEWNTANAQRMAPATDRLYQSVTEQTITHDADATLRAHVAHAVAKRTPLGDLISKDKRGSTRKIDAAVAAIVASDRAAWHAANSAPRRRAFSYR